MTEARTRWLCAISAFVLVLLSCWRIAATYDEFWQTWDEPFHLACGLEWWERGTYTYERFHPPLARICIAFLPYMAGLKGDPSAENHWIEGNELLHSGGSYERNLALARLGVLPFFVIASVVVFLWAMRCGGAFAGLCAVGLFVLLPPVLAHAGMAALDMANAAMVAAALYAFQCWCDKPGLIRGGIFGTTAGLAVMTKFSAVPFLAAGLMFMLVLRRSSPGTERAAQRWIPSAAAAFAAAALVIWGGYRFSLESIQPVGNGLDALLEKAGPMAVPIKDIVRRAPVPAGGFFWGLYDLLVFRRSDGHLAFFLGEVSKHGWWLFYPVLLLLKTPLPFLVLVGGALFTEGRQWWRRHRGTELSAPMACAFGVLVAAAVATPNNGLRQALAVYPLLAVVAGCAFAGLWRSAASSVLRACLAVILLVWSVAVPVMAHPDYLSYFNPLAGADPSKIVVNSDLDWGQDLKRLKAVCERREIAALTLKYNGSKDIDLSRFGLPVLTELEPGQRPSGWVALSLNDLRRGSGDPPYDQYAWLGDVEPVETAGHSIRVYFFPSQ
ncbi:MAG: hypothetical protein IAE97_03520 [Chthoniobacterales bacterium]|nr:hypothetical protein [Chthoniobacterales bacterium]